MKNSDIESIKESMSNLARGCIKITTQIAIAICNSKTDYSKVDPDKLANDIINKLELNQDTVDQIVNEAINNQNVKVSNSR